MDRSIALSLVASALLGVPAAAQNLAVNPDFDDDVVGWTLRDGGSLFWSSSDERGCGGSGSAVATSQEIPIPPSGAIYVVGVTQCLDAPVSGKLSLTLMRTSTVPTSMFLSFHATGGCGDGSPTVVSAALASTTGWEAGDLLDVDVPAGTQSVRFGLEAASSSFFTDVGLDRVYLGSSRPVFLDGFDGDLVDETMPCRWSAAVP